MTMSDQEILIPQIEGDWWRIAGNPDLGRYNTERQQPLDFGIWQAADQTWQLASCVRRTGCGGRGRLFYRWQANSLLEEDWQPMGIFMEADPNFGEKPGGLQAPFVLKHQDEYFMFYGDWVNICSAWSKDGKTFARLLNPDNLSGMFTEGHRSSCRDPMVMAFRDKFYIYYTGVPAGKGAIYCRVSSDLRHWSDSVIVNSGGSGGEGPQDAECPFVLYFPSQYSFYLFRAHPAEGKEGYETSVFCSPNPLDFGVDSDQYKVATLPVEAARIIYYEQQYYVAALQPDLQGIRMARLKWVPKD
ncbi:MAG: hypothetical protein DRJ06_03250 [Candidatus Aminicenantes bacterium]|nr:MAG: hypothetical protein DRJ06_03250 [Candidatus Aminicenantes bacterium]